VSAKLNRFYKEVSTRADGAGHAVLLDGRPVKTPAGAVMLLPTASLAEVLAAEWRGQGEKIDLQAMRLTRLAQTAIDRVSQQSDAVAAQILGYGRSDLLCYRAESPSELALRQAQIWDPLLEWAQIRFGAGLKTAKGIAFIEQAEEAHAAFARALEPHDPFRLSGLHTGASLLGSLVLALALEDGKLSPAEAFAVSLLDETYQAELWGLDEEVLARNADRAREVADIAVFLRALA